MTRRIAWSQQFLKVPFAMLDGAIAGAIGMKTLLVYLMICRFQQRATHRDRRINKQMQMGKLIAFVDQGRVAHLLGLSRQTVCKACRQLLDLGWIRVVKLKDNRRAYVIGRKVRSDGGRLTERFLAHDRIARALEDLPDEAATWSDSSIELRCKHLSTALPDLADLSAATRVRDVTQRDTACDVSAASVNPRDNQAVASDDFPAVATAAKRNRVIRRKRSKR